MQASMSSSDSSELDRPINEFIKARWELAIFIILIILAVVTRFYDLETRVMSHDETSHVYFSWLFSQGRGYSHDPVTHGPLQFHLVALSYFLFGDSDLTARIPAALFSIATVAFMWPFRRHLGRFGALIGAGLLLISPFLLYYGRYVRNEAFVGLFGVITFWAILNYLETGAGRYLFWLSAATALHFTTKETAFIYTAQALLFLAIILVYRLITAAWNNPKERQRFIILLLISLAIFGLGGILLSLGQANNPQAVIPNVPTPAGEMAAQSTAGPSAVSIGLLGLGLAGLASAVWLAIRGFTWKRLREERSLSLLVILGTMVLPMLSPFPVKLMGYNPIDYQNISSMTVTSIWIALLAAIAVAIGILWNWRLWLMNAAIFYGIFTLFYTTIFTYGTGFLTGMVGSLGYWLEQQGVERGSQPWYFYGLIQIPIYEFLPALGTLLTIFWGARWIKRPSQPSQPDLPPSEIEVQTETETSQTEPILPDASLSTQTWSPAITVGLLVFWSLTSLLAYSVAGEKMPWLTFHIALPMILITAWFLGQLVEKIDWKAFRSQKGLLVLLLLPVFFTSLSAAFGSLLGTKPPFQGKELEQLRATSTFLTAIISSLASGWGIAYLVKEWSTKQLLRIISLTIFGLLAILTARAAFRAAYINYDDATEYLVYAHSASGPKIALSQIEEISLRTTGDLAVKVAYDNETTYPFWWYLRNYSNQEYYQSQPSRALRDAPVILVGEANYGKIEPVVGQAYDRFDYVRIWWPNQDYFDLTWERIKNALLNPQIRAGIFQIWLNRDYQLYGEATGKDMSLTNWTPSAKMRLYIRKDITASLWNYGVGPSTEEIVADPYEGKQLDITADLVIGSPGVEAGQFRRPRGIAIAPDNTIYVADTENHRIQHLDHEGNVLQVWGSFADISLGAAPGGTFFEPWGIAVDQEGFVYVADTWNHRIQKFSPSGEFLNTWGYFGQAETPFALWGPRDIVIDAVNRIYVTDTGNKRVVIYNPQGDALGSFGSVGMAPGQFDEPVGLALSSEQQLYVADTWNQRIQAFNIMGENQFEFRTSWDITGWYGQSLDNKPFLAGDSSGRVYATDPEAYRVLIFSQDGEFIGFWGDLSTGVDGFSLVGDIAIDEDDSAWVTDPGNNRLLHFQLPLPSGDN